MIISASREGASVSPIILKRMEEKIRIEGYGSIRQALSVALVEKNGFYGNVQHISKELKDCVSQSLLFLKSIDALKEKKDNNIKSIPLWKKWIKLDPFYEGINISLSSMLIKHHNPRAASEMEKGVIYSSRNLDRVQEAVLYTLEYLTKEDLLKDPEHVIKNPRLLQLIEEHNKYLEDNREELEAKSLARDKKIRDDMASISKRISELPSLSGLNMDVELETNKQHNKTLNVLHKNLKQPRQKFPKSLRKVH